jgi:hypothetical protein
MRRSKTFTVEYNYFEPGTRITPTSNRCPLERGVYVVTKCIEPRDAQDEAVCFVQGRKTGISTTYLREVD